MFKSPVKEPTPDILQDTSSKLAMSLEIVKRLYSAKSHDDQMPFVNFAYS